MEDFSTVCRTCATVTEFVIPIFDGEGLQNNLAEKIHKHLPIQVLKKSNFSFIMHERKIQLIFYVRHDDATKIGVDHVDALFNVISE